MQTTKLENGRKLEPKVHLLLSREESSMVSTWTNHLGLSKISEKTWRIGTYGYNWLGSIYDLVPEDQLYDEAGELVIPDEWEGHKVLGLADGEYLETDELVSSDYVDFTQSQIKIARAFCSESGWSDLADFDRGFLRVVSEVKPNQPLHRYSEFKGRPVLRTGYGANPSYSGEAELGVFQTDSLTEIWAWDSESGAECVVTINFSADLKSLVDAVAKGDHFAGSVDLESLRIKGIDQTDGLVLALAWDGEEASKTVARLLSLWPKEVITKVLGKKGLRAINLAQIGDQALELANDLDVDVDEIKRVPIPEAFDEVSVLKSMTDAVRRVATNKRRQEARFRKEIAPFSAQIDTMVTAFLKGKPKGYYPGAGYVVPPSGGISLRNFLTHFAKKNKKMPTGKVSVPYEKGEFRSPRGSFEVDIDKLAKG